LVSGGELKKFLLRRASVQPRPLTLVSGKELKIYLLRRARVRPTPLTLISGGELKIYLLRRASVRPKPLTLVSGGELKKFSPINEYVKNPCFYSLRWGASLKTPRPKPFLGKNVG